MSPFHTIEIDFDVHKAIADRQNFTESPNDVLRRLLRIEGCPPERDGQSRDGRSWWYKGVELPHGTKLRMKYGPCEYTGVIHNGHWLVEGREYGSPSGAAGGVAVTKKGQKTQLDGWIYWEVKRPFDQSWIVINRLR